MELRHLITEERPRVPRIHDAKLDGDISENAEYEDAKQEQSFLRAGSRPSRPAQERRGHRALQRGQGPHRLHGRHPGPDGKETFTIVGSAEAAPREGRISNESPVGVALMGHKKGDTITVQAPAGAMAYTLVSIK